jgi:hypothetical protein
LEKEEPVQLEDKKGLNTDRSSLFFPQEYELIPDLGQKKG